MSPQAGFLLQDQIIPRLKSAVPQVVNCVGAEDPAELVQDSTAFAAKLLHNAELAGKRVVRSACARGARKARTISAGNICFYTLQHMKSGRTSTGSSVADVYGSATQLKGRTRLDSMDQVVASDDETGGEIYELHDVLASPQEDPATKAARKMDWDAFMAGLSERDKAIIQFIVEGRPLTKLARRRQLNLSTMMYHKERLGKAILDFISTDILIEVRRLPQWKQDLQAIREKMECRDQRRHL